MKPNIVFAFADDWGRYASAYAPHEGDSSINHLLHTPNFDRIAVRRRTVSQCIGTSSIVHSLSKLDPRGAVLLADRSWRDSARCTLG